MEDSSTIANAIKINAIIDIESIERDTPLILRKCTFEHRMLALLCEFGLLACQFTLHIFSIQPSQAVVRVTQLLLE
jgi:hypothetical protein